ncbi:MAG: hypothetical protein CVU90_00755 [Firmicutes bacterium HGW-Firmicutes-15]|nr:MAG: hypothetical protein CVU90_00755 [Firmicutes bacterium HGW-Firmicutes-15]
MDKYANLYKEKLCVPDEAVNSAPWAMGGEHIASSEADYIVEQIRDGACLQLRMGVEPGVIGKLMIGERGLRRLGVHLEIYLDILKNGIITGAKKLIDHSKKGYDYINGNLTYATYSVNI